jgi:hypothetical protein
MRGRSASGNFLPRTAAVVDHAHLSKYLKNVLILFQMPALTGNLAVPLQAEPLQSTHDII